MNKDLIDYYIKEIERLKRDGYGLRIIIKDQKEEIQAWKDSRDGTLSIIEDLQDQLTKEQAKVAKLKKDKESK
jgi:hypothetical protein